MTFTCLDYATEKIGEITSSHIEPFQQLDKYKNLLDVDLYRLINEQVKNVPEFRNMY